MLLFISLSLIPTVVGVLYFIMYFPQIRMTYRTKDASTQSTSFWAILVVALSLKTVNAVVTLIMTGEPGYLAMEIVNLTLAGVVLTLVIKYKKKERRT